MSVGSSKICLYLTDSKLATVGQNKDSCFLFLFLNIQYDWCGSFIRASNTEKQISILPNKISIKNVEGVHYSSDLLIALKELLKIASGCGKVMMCSE